MKQEHVITADGSSSIYIEGLDEHYHSSHGALQEARHVFIENGIKMLSDKSHIRVFEMGFGTGLNALLTSLYAAEHSIQVDYTGIEAYPVDENILKELNYVDQVGQNVDELFRKIHQVEWAEFQRISNLFRLRKIQEKIEVFTSEDTFDIVYFDAFGHRAQPEMWDKLIIEKIARILEEGGVFVTYAARGQLKRDLLSLGFEVEKLPGPPGKREMIRAIKR